MNIKNLPNILRSWASGAVLIAMAPMASAEDYPTIRIGQQFWPSLNLLAQSQGYFEEEFAKLGAEVVFTTSETGAGMNVALASDGVDFAFLGGTPAVTLISQNVPVKIIWVADKVDSAEGLVVREGISSIADLRGRKVGAPFVSTSHYGLLAALDLGGLTQGDVELLDLRPQDAVAAFARGDVDGVFVWDPARTRMMNDFGAVDLMTAGELEKASDGKVAIWDVMVVRTEIIEKYPELVEAFVTAMNRATLVAQDDLRAAAEGMKELMGAESADDALKSIGGIVYVNAQEHIDNKVFEGLADILQPMAQFFADAGQLERAPSREEIMGAMYLDAAAAVADRQ